VGYDFSKEKCIGAMPRSSQNEGISVDYKKVEFLGLDEWSSASVDSRWILFITLLRISLLL